MAVRVAGVRVWARQRNVTGTMQRSVIHIDAIRVGKVHPQPIRGFARFAMPDVVEENNVELPEYGQR